MSLNDIAVLIGNPVAHSLSPVFQQAAFDHMNINARYEAWETYADELKQKIDLLRSSEYLGANITIPYKLDSINFVDSIDDIAEQVGAINTIISRNGILAGTNTDVEGIQNSFKLANVNLKNKNVILFGAGGAARAVMVAMKNAGVKAITVINRTEKKAKDFELFSDSNFKVSILSAHLATSQSGKIFTNADIIINATSLGMSKGESELLSPIPQELLYSSQVVFDLVYTPEQTPLLQMAESAGAQCIGGLAMLVFQGAASFRLWTDKNPPLEVMFRAAKKELDY
ncbi:MAG: shikimate dehydrogenase [Dehalococcoidia bacterium]|nr:shikimate dehydrogenase [Dehalococcoidia bacterium]